jgi:heme-degrading monooxygenase HmoA
MTPIDPPRTQGTRIARIWSAYATPANASAYIDHFSQAVLPVVRRISGYAGATVLRNDEADLVEITVMTRWKSMDAIREFAGDPIDQAVVTEHARQLLVSFDERVRHMRVAIEDGRAT